MGMVPNYKHAKGKGTFKRLPVDDSIDFPNQSIISRASSLPASTEYEYTDNTLRAELLRLGYNPGPIVDSTRTLYLQKLHALKKTPVGCCNKKVGKTKSIELEESLHSDDWTKNEACRASIKYDNNILRDELWRLGHNPGPIVDSTRTPERLKKPQAIKKTPIVVCSKKVGKNENIELGDSLRSDDWMRNLSPYNELEVKVRADFSDSNKQWPLREGTTKTSFTYLLLDPRLTNNLPAKAGKQNPHLSWITFVNSIFYVGKGKRSRPYSHLKEALTFWKKDYTTTNEKVQHILDIWSDNVGVICLHIFQNVIPAEAYTYEAAMIDAIGVQNLKNLRVGNYYGAVASWPLEDKRMLGLYLLYKAMQIFLSEGERQLRPDDID